MFYKRLSATLVVIGLSLGLSACGWVYNEEGRLDFKAAVIADIAHFIDRPFVMDAEARLRANEGAASYFDGLDKPEVGRVEDFTIPGPGGPIPVRAYFPEGKGPFPIFLQFHGGGFWMGNDHRHSDPLARRITRDVKAITLVPDYRLAPEHPFPAGFDDCYALLEWAADHGVEIGGDPTRLAVGGGSAGGNLAAAVALKARDIDGPPIAFQLLMVPVTDLSGLHQWESMEKFSEGYVLTASSMRAMRKAYIVEESVGLLPYASPYISDNLKNLPPALIITTQFDPLRDEGEAYGKRLEEAGVDVTVKRYDGALHGFIGSSDKMQSAYKDGVLALRDAFQRR